MIFFLWNIFRFLVQEKCLQTTLHPEWNKELKNLLLKAISAWKSGKSYWGGIFSALIWGIQVYSLLGRWFRRISGSTSITVHARHFLDWCGNFMAMWLSFRMMTEADHVDYCQRAYHSSWSPAYQFCAQGPCSASFRCSLPSRSWGPWKGRSPTLKSVLVLLPLCTDS